GKLYQTLPLYSNLKTTGVYVYAKDIDVGRRTANITAETEIRNEYAEPKTFSYDVEVANLDGKVVKKIDGGKYTLNPNETRIVSATDTLSDLNFWSWGYGYLYTVRTSIRVDGRIVDLVVTQTGFRKT